VSILFRSIAIQAIICFIAFQAISFYQERNMLSTNTPLSQSPNADDLVFDNIATTLGDTVSLKAQGKTTIIYFFAPWCSVCHASISNLQSLFEQNENIDVIAVALDYTSFDQVLMFTNEHQLTFPVALGNEKIKKAFSVSAYPIYYVIDEKNEVVARSMGYSTKLGLYLRSL